MNGPDADDEMFNTDFLVGDLIWTKVGKHPFWPCMVSYDPSDESNTFIKFVKGKGQDNQVAVYHVQYFGQLVQHGWTRPGNSFRFNGQEDYFKTTQEFLAKKASALGPTAIKNLKAKFDVPAASKEKWSIAVKEAEEALKIENRIERFENYVFIYEKVKRKSPVSNGEKLKRKNSLSNGNAVRSNGSSDSIDKSEKCDILLGASSSSSASSYSHVGSAYSPAMRERLSKMNCKCSICKTAGPEVRLLCDKKECVKTYHLRCLGLSECPTGFWECPMHFCVFCEQEPDEWCKFCPTGYCKECMHIFPKPDYYDCGYVGYHGAGLFF